MIPLNSHLLNSLTEGTLIFFFLVPEATTTSFNDNSAPERVEKTQNMTIPDETFDEKQGSNP